ncbi:outer membrane beta-barrel protein [Vibrio mediterranei]|uniref:outer membrane beta-barrel protein n=1 Tax=Vibrio mediterranei TaxID=689 RepID=UPI0040687245
MKKTTLALIVGTVSFGSYASQDNETAEGKMSIGLDYISSSNTFEFQMAGDSANIDDDSSAFGINLGFKKSNNGQWFISYQNESFDMGIYDTNNEPLHYFSGGYNKEFPLHNGFAPYIKGSLGVGTMSITGYTESSATAVGAKVGAGLGYYFTNKFKITLGIDAQYRVWTPVNFGYGDIDISDQSFIASIGAGYYF